MKFVWHYGYTYKPEQLKPHLWFAWYPLYLVASDHSVAVWLEYVERKPTPEGVIGGTKWVYRPLEESCFMRDYGG